MSKQEFARILEEGCPRWSAEQRERVVEFYEAMGAENEVQNLTRLMEPQEFFERHVLDVKELLDWGKEPLFKARKLDLGSGGGVPGLLAAAAGCGNWVLAESEGRKAAFLEKTAQKMGLLGSSVEVFAGRGEKFLEKNTVDFVIARAVGPVLRMFSWFEKCSTWNKMILFKGPGWEKEWKEFSDSKFAGRLELEEDFSYTSGAEKRKFRLVILRNVPRGTKK